MTRSRDTEIGGENREFPPTRLVWAGPGRADEEFCLLYWKPIYAYIRAVRRVPPEDAKDLTQEFLADSIQSLLLSRYRSDLGPFRVFLRGAIRRFLGKRHRADAALKRGGDRVTLSLDETACRDIDTILLRRRRAPADAFDAQWRRSMFEQAVEDLRREWTAAGKMVPLQVFEAYELAEKRSTYPAIARAHGITEADVNNYLRAARKRLKELVALKPE